MKSISQNTFSITIATIIAIAVTSCNSLLESILQTGPNPTSTVEKCIKSFGRKELDTVYELFTQEYKSKVGQKPGLKLAMDNMQTFSAGKRAEDSIEIVEIKQNRVEGNSASVTASIMANMIGGKRLQRSEYSLIRENGAWRIDDIKRRCCTSRVMDTSFPL
jgi:hypothetical protein